MHPKAASLCKPKPLEIKVKLAKQHELVPRELHKDYHPEYAVVGGFVFVIAGHPLLEDARRKGEYYSCFNTILDIVRPPPDNNTVGGGAASRDTFTDKETQGIICCRILAHSINEGYNELEGERLKSVNGVRVKNMRQVETPHAFATENLLENTDGAPHQRALGVAACCLLFMLTRAILMPSYVLKASGRNADTCLGSYRYRRQDVNPSKRQRKQGGSIAGAGICSAVDVRLFACSGA